MDLTQENESVPQNDAGQTPPVSVLEMASACVEEIQKAGQELETLNIMVIGKSGVGKSTLINNVFRKRIAIAGSGEPVTQTIQRHTVPGFPLQIYDTPGLELGEEQQRRVKADVASYIRKGAAQGFKQKIHCIWFCISSSGGRIEKEEQTWLYELTKDSSAAQVPVIVVLTKASSREETESLRAKISAMNLPVKDIVPVLADYWKINDRQAIKPHGLRKLISVTAQCLPETLNNTLQNVQGVSVAGKSEAAIRIVTRTSTEAFGIGFSPIPVSDAVLLVPLQIKMIAQISSVYGIDVDRSILVPVISATVGAGGATVLGKTVVVNLIKLIPGAGTAVGGMISGATAGALTTALGMAYIKLMEAMLKGEVKRSDLESREGTQIIQKLFQEALRSG